VELAAPVTSRALPALASDDARLLETVGAALELAARRAGASLACRPGCTECCIGPFPISALDAERLRRGLAELEAQAPGRAAAIRERANAAVVALSVDFPGDAGAGVVDDDAPAADAFFARHEKEPCPALDPRTGWCELYRHRPTACRTFGPPMRIEGQDLPPCRLCFVDATPAAVEAARTELPVGELEERLESRARESGHPSPTLIAFALARP